MSAHGGRTHVSEESEGLVRAAFSAPRTRASGFSVVRRHHASPLDSLKRRSVNLRLRATTEADVAKSRLAAACRRRAWRLATTSSGGASPPTATLRVSSRHRTRKPASRDTERRGNSVPPHSRLSVFFRVGLQAAFALRGAREFGFPRTFAFPCSSVSAARPLPRPGGTQAEGASRRGGADRGVSLKVMRRSAAMNRASDCRPARLQWSRASANRIRTFPQDFFHFPFSPLRTVAGFWYNAAILRHSGYSRSGASSSP